MKHTQASCNCPPPDAHTARWGRPNNLTKDVHSRDPAEGRTTALSMTLRAVAGESWNLRLIAPHLHRAIVAFRHTHPTGRGGLAAATRNAGAVGLTS